MAHHRPDTGLTRPPCVSTVFGTVVFAVPIPEGVKFGRGEIWDGEMWHNKIVPHLAMVFSDRSQDFLAQRQGMQGAEPLEQP